MKIKEMIYENSGWTIHVDDNGIYKDGVYRIEIVGYSEKTIELPLFPLIELIYNNLKK